MSATPISERLTLKEHLEQLVRRGDFVTVARARLMGYLASVLKYQHMIVISPEEFIFRLHIDPFRTTGRGGNVFVRRDVFTHVNTFVQLGYGRPVAIAMVDDAVKRMVYAQILNVGASTDGQCTYATTRVIDTQPEQFDLVIEQIRSLRD